MHNYYQIVSQSVASCTASFEVVLFADCDVYRGHFPRHHIAPGACNLEMIRQCASLAMGHEIHFSILKQCKFLALVEPEINPELHLDMKWDSDSLQAALSCDGNIVMRLKAQF